MIPVIHYVNQFFAGVGGEDKADVPLGLKEGAIGPGRALQGHLPKDFRIVATLFCGDSYFNEKRDMVLRQIVDLIKPRNPRLLIAGPAFDAGRYGFACAEVCNAVAKELGIPCLAAMYPENPGVEAYRSHKNMKTYVLPTTASAVGMQEALGKIGQFAGRLLSGAEIGPAAREEYIPRGIRVLGEADRCAAKRAVEMLLAKVSGHPFTTELSLGSLDPVTPAQPVANLSQASIALVSTSGVVPWGNPDGFKRHANTQWKKYSIENSDSLEKGKWEAIHGGYSTVFINENPNFGSPVDALRTLEREGVFARLHPFYYVTPGNVGSLKVMQRLGKEIAEDIKVGGVTGVVLVST